MNSTQKSKTKFRASKKWKDFRHYMNIQQKGIDPITGKKLFKGANLHHRHVTADIDEYTDISNPDHYVMLNHQTHEFLHWLYRYWKNDPSIIDRIILELKKWY